MDDLKNYREEINHIDHQLKKLLKLRFRVAKQIGQYKKDHNLPIFDASREQEILDELQHEPMKEVYQTILKVSKEIQTWDDLD